MTTRLRPHYRPRIEPLEERTVLSTLTVLNGNDQGAGSLRQAICDAPSGSKIVFAGSVHAITLTSGELDVAKNLNIAGPGAKALTLSGNDASRVLHVEGGAAVRVAGLTIAHGRAGSTGYGAIPGGGGIRNEAGATLTLDQVALNGNQAVGVEGLDEFGGGLFNLGRATLGACTLTNNQVVGAGSFTAIGGSAGGAIENFGGANLVVTDTTFADNRVVS